MFFLHIVDFDFFTASHAGIICRQAPGFLESAVRQFFSVCLDDDMGAGSLLRMEPPVIPGSKVKGQFIVLQIVFPHIDMIAVKNSYELMWDVMNGSVMKKLRAMLESSGNTFFEIAMTLKTKDLTDHVSGSGDEGVDTQAFEEDIQMGGTVYLSDMTYTPYFINGGFVWKDVSVKFVER